MEKNTENNLENLIDDQLIELAKKSLSIGEHKGKLRSLTPRQKEVLFAFENLEIFTSEEAAKKLKAHVGTVKSIINVVLDKLQICVHPNTQNLSFQEKVLIAIMLVKELEQQKFPVYQNKKTKKSKQPK